MKNIKLINLSEIARILNISRRAVVKKIHKIDYMKFSEDEKNKIKKELNKFIKVL